MIKMQNIILQLNVLSDICISIVCQTTNNLTNIIIKFSFLAQTNLALNAGSRFFFNLEQKIRVFLKENPLNSKVMFYSISSSK